MKAVRSALITVTCLAAFLLAGCGGEETVDISDYLGKYDYQSPAAALVWEQVEGEDEGVYGMQYRKVTDFNGLTSQKDTAVCLYFYSASARGTQSLTAGVEDLAQTLVGQVIFVAVDGVEADEISTAYHVAGYPDFILINDGMRIDTFNGFDREEWNIEDVADWLADYGFTPDLTMLER